MINKVRFLLGIYFLYITYKILPDSIFKDSLIMSIDFDLLKKEKEKLYETTNCKTQ